MKISIAQVKRMLPVGTEFTAEFIGSINTKVFGNKGVINLNRSEDEVKTKRIVVKQGSEMSSRILTGPDQGKMIYCNWKNVVARQENESIILNHHDNDFLKITVQK